MGTANELKMLQALPLDVKIEKTKLRIKEWYEAFDGNVYVSISGGKDSQVLAHIVKSIYTDVSCVFVNTGLEYDSVRLKGTELADTILRPEMDFVNVIKKYGYPVISKEVAKCVSDYRGNKTKSGKYFELLTKKFNGNVDFNGKKGMFNIEKYKFLLDAPFKISPKCCDVMKKKVGYKYEKQTGKSVILGTMADESLLRKQKWMKFGCNAFDQKGHKTSQPLSFWTEQDILKYIKKFNLDIADIYGDVIYTDKDGMQYDNDLFGLDMPLTTTGVKRTGCVFCMFGITQDTEKFLKLKQQEPLKYDYVMRGGKFDEDGMWIPAPDENGKMGLGYKFVIDWLNKNGNLGIKY